MRDSASKTLGESDGGRHWMMTLVHKHKHMHIYAHAWPWCTHPYECEHVHHTHSNLENDFQLEQLYLFQFCYYYFFGFSVLLNHPHWAHTMWPKLTLTLQTSCFKFLNTRTTGLHHHTRLTPLFLVEVISIICVP